ncbi:erythroblast NAD(P)(+)--arginine ADP-ribosyltransferase-like [Anas acuta]|uniref:erythroblast NAD(P)(+)--arginine ADP-ribosyltransferase-like n=1 Tax=Anas acuta TaxID=28680 RepID=UPI0035C8EB75
MEHLGLGWVLLAGTLAGTLAVSSTREQEPGRIREEAMDMAQNSFDDRYQGCRNKMKVALKKVHHAEFKNHILADAWKEAKKKWKNSNRPQGLPRDYALAVLAYTADTDLYKEFNTAVRDGGRSRDYYLQSFPFKTLHFFLTVALQTLRKAQGHKCYNVYRGVRGIQFTASQHHTVRFGQFASASLNESIAQEFGQDTFFIVYTCHGVSIKHFSFFAKEDEVLIPPYEVFKVTKFTQDRNGNVIHLRSRGARSTYKCALVKGKGSQQGGCPREMAGDRAQPWAGAAVLPALLQPWLQRNGGPVPPAL